MWALRAPTRPVLHFWNLPTRSAITRLRAQVATLSGEVQQLAENWRKPSAPVVRRNARRPAGQRGQEQGEGGDRSRRRTSPWARWLAGVRREVERTQFRARNGIKYLTGGEWAPPDPTPSDTVWRRGKTQLRRYRRDARHGSARRRAFIGLVRRTYILDLWKGNSFVQRLMDAGFDAFVLDWGEPDEADAANTLETYVQRHLPRALEAVTEETGSDDVNMIGYCMGGNLALVALAAQPELPVRNLVLMATPVDLRHLGPLAEALRDGRIDTESLIDDTGNIPAALVDKFFRIRKPTSDAVQYANLWQNLWNDDYMQGYPGHGPLGTRARPDPKRRRSTARRSVAARQRVPQRHPPSRGPAGLAGRRPRADARGDRHARRHRGRACGGAEWWIC